jgi:glycosyltransferase involved in cell wall biosynthesis
MDKLIKLYETCDVYVGSGRAEPWGMRLNDALNCGAPLVVSTGMGGVKIVRDFGCGLVFNNGDANDLALKLQSLIKDEGVYNRCARNVSHAINHCSPEFNAKYLISIVRGI